MHVYFPGGLNEAAQKILTAAGRAAEVARSHAAAVDAEGRFPLEAIGALAGEGLYGLCVATEHGGLGQGPAMFAAVVETLAQACASTAMITSCTSPRRSPSPCLRRSPIERPSSATLPPGTT